MPARPAQAARPVRRNIAVVPLSVSLCPQPRRAMLRLCSAAHLGRMGRDEATKSVH